MKNRAEIYILSGIIVILSLYIILRQDRNLNYSVPEFTKITSEDITKITFDSIEMSKTNGNWLLTSGYKIDNNKLSRILGDVSSISVIDKISDTEDLKRFGLDSGKTLTVFKNGKEVLSINIGSTSSTGNYTYIKIPQTKGIFSVRGDIASLFGNSEDDLRSKEVLTTSDIKEITLTKGEEVITKSGGELPDLSFLSSLKADTLKEGVRDETLLTLSIKDGDSLKTLIIYNKDGSSYPATSSDVDFPFTLPEYLVKKIQDIK